MRERVNVWPYRTYDYPTCFSKREILLNNNTCKYILNFVYTVHVLVSLNKGILLIVDLVLLTE